MKKSEKLAIWISIIGFIITIAIVTVIVKNDFYAKEKCYRAGYSNSSYLGGENKAVLCSNWKLVE